MLSFKVVILKLFFVRGRERERERERENGERNPNRKAKTPHLEDNLVIIKDPKRTRVCL